jgi:hypothetical protein
LVGNLRDGNVSRNVWQSTTKKNNQGNLQYKYVSFLEKRACGPTKTKSTTPTMAPKKTKKEQATHWKAALQKKLAAQRSKALEPKVSLHDGDSNNDSTCGLEEAEVSGQTTVDEEGLIQSNKDSKQKSPPPTSIQSYRHTKQPKKLVSSENSNKQRTTMPDHEKNKKQQDQIPMIQLEAKKEIVTKTTKPKAIRNNTPTLKTNKQQNTVGDRTQSPPKLRAVLIKTEGQ